MPFIGADWRSPGEFWIKIDSGWEPARLLEVSNPKAFEENVVLSSSPPSSGDEGVVGDR